MYILQIHIYIHIHGRKNRLFVYINVMRYSSLPRCVKLVALCGCDGGKDISCLRVTRSFWIKGSSWRLSCFTGTLFRPVLVYSLRVSICPLDSVTDVSIIDTD